VTKADPLDDASNVIKEVDGMRKGPTDLGSSGRPCAACAISGRVPG
jgi:hypothetical protein